jgi:hypothetical protein
MGVTSADSGNQVIFLYTGGDVIAIYVNGVSSGEVKINNEKK